MYINNLLLLSVDAQAVVTYRELKFPHLSLYLIEHKNEEENDSCHL